MNPRAEVASTCVFWSESINNQSKSDKVNFESWEYIFGIIDARLLLIDGFEFDKLHSISTEGREKLKAIQPKTIGQASRISGVSPSDINVLLIYLGRWYH